MNRHSRRKQKTQQTPKVNTDPITKDNPAVAAHLAYFFAEDLRKQGKHKHAEVAKEAADNMTMEVGRLPPGTEIPESVRQEVYPMVTECFGIAMLQVAFLKTGRAKGSA